METITEIDIQTENLRLAAKEFEGILPLEKKVGRKAFGQMLSYYGVTDVKPLSFFDRLVDFFSLRPYRRNAFRTNAILSIARQLPRTY